MYNYVPDLFFDSPIIMESNSKPRESFVYELCEIQHNGILFAKLEDIWPCVWNSIEYVCMHVFLMT